MSNLPLALQFIDHISLLFGRPANKWSHARNGNVVKLDTQTCNFPLLLHTTNFRSFYFEKKKQLIGEKKFFLVPFGGHCNSRATAMVLLITKLHHPWGACKLCMITMITIILNFFFFSIALLEEIPHNSGSPHLSLVLRLQLLFPLSPWGSILLIYVGSEGRAARH